MGANDPYPTKWRRVMWRSRYIAPRRHPVALSAYLLICLLGALFVFGVFQSAAIDALLGSSFWRLVWEWMLTIGGALALLGAVWGPDLEDALLMERLGAATSAVGLVTYSTAITWGIGFRASTWLLLGSLALGCLVRVAQLTKELRRVKNMVREFGGLS